MAGLMSIDGLASGLNTTDIITKLVALEKKPLTKLEEQKTTLETQKEAWRNMNLKLLNLRNSVYTLKSNLTFKGRTASVSDKDVLSVSVGSGTTPATYNIEVSNLAKAHTIKSDQQATSSTSLALAGTIKINGKDVVITAEDTLDSVADKINSTDQVGVTASVVKVATDDYRLMLTSKTTGTGTENEIELVDGGGVLASLGLLNPANEVQAGEDATIKVNGVAITRSSNSISDAISGVTLNLNNETLVGKTVQVKVDTDLNKIVDAVKTFVEQYNSTMNLIDEDLAYNQETQVKGILFGDSTLQLAQSQLRRFLSRTAANVDTSVNQLSMVGLSTGPVGSDIEVGKAGNLILDETVLRQKLTNNFEDVAKLFGAAVTNVASSKKGATIAEASPAVNGNYPAASMIDGVTSSASWGQGGGYSGTGALPQYASIKFAQLTAINKINLYTLDSATYPAATYGIKDYTLYYSANDAGEDWTQIGAYTGNTKGFISNEFNTVNARRIKVEVNAVNVNAAGSANLVEVEAYQENNGIFSDMYDSLFELTRTGGTAAKKIDSFTSQMKSMDDQINVLEKRLADTEERYQKRFAAMELALSKLQTQSNWLSSQISAMDGSKSE